MHLPAELFGLVHDGPFDLQVYQGQQGQHQHQPERHCYGRFEFPGQAGFVVIH
jgi:hypothetical protein